MSRLTRDAKGRLSRTCQVPDCPNPATWLCATSGLRYCEAHKHPHGTGPEDVHRYVRYKNHPEMESVKMGKMGRSTEWRPVEVKDV